MVLDVGSLPKAGVEKGRNHMTARFSVCGNIHPGDRSPPGVHPRYLHWSAGRPAPGAWGLTPTSLLPKSNDRGVYRAGYSQPSVFQQPPGCEAGRVQPIWTPVDFRS